MSLKTVGQLSTASAISAASNLVIVEQAGYARSVSVANLVSNMISQVSAASAISSTSDLMMIEQGGLARQDSVYDIVGGGLPAGMITAYGGSSAPTGWLICNGAAVNRLTYSKLFAAISTGWGVGDGVNTFNVPDLRELSPVGIGTCGSLITSTGSAMTAHDVYTLAQVKDDQLQGHIHQEYAQNAPSGGAITGVILTANTQDPKVGVPSTYTGVPYTDGTNGTPRTGTTTRGKRAGVNYIIKY